LRLDVVTPAHDGEHQIETPRSLPNPGEQLVRALVVVPTFNEAESISELLDRTLRSDPRVDVLVVDDNSLDGTARLVKALMASQARLHLLERSGKQGLGTAYRAGFDWGLDHGYDVLVEMDADLSHPPEKIPALLDGLRDADVVIGSRYVPGGRTVNWSRARAALSRTGNAYVRLALHLPVHDATAGFRAYRRAVLRALAMDTVQSNGYCFQVEMAHRAWQQGFRIAETPITFTDRVTGESKMQGRIVVEALARVTRWALTGGRRRARAHHPASVVGHSPI
jgi:GT2 family glycosyltransferase